MKRFTLILLPNYPSETEKLLTTQIFSSLNLFTSAEPVTQYFREVTLFPYLQVPENIWPIFSQLLRVSVFLTYNSAPKTDTHGIRGEGKPLRKHPNTTTNLASGNSPRLLLPPF